ncbi:UDP-glucuronosyltransferase 2B7 [Exaiptasia diaphana]|uniref:UDP-glucuronosyltransferase n=1 Tax=Exaiptasia diaphana TaxID=2652724 RepID=A0A913WQD4_EXADI|nr:UDP-glucuronosyltransferase 2B7 [Exaiptasia diaphana]
MIGPVNIQPVKPLPPDLQQLMDSSGDDGAIIVSFGSNVASMSKEKVDIMAEAFGRLKQKVIWRLKGYIPPSLSSNIKPVSWLPQSDLLSHKKLRLFVSHVGQNSLYEAAYRGVPLVAIPLFGDQPDNAKLLEFRGFGLSLDYQKLTADDMQSTIERVLKDASFRENAQRISRLMQDRPRSPVQEAGDWIEYALRHESLAHLRPYSGQLAWYQYFLVDVAVFLVLVVLVVIMVIKYAIRLMCWVCCRRDKKQKTQ